MTTGRVTISSPERLLWPADGISKAALADYYVAIAPVLLPHLRDRPLVLRPFPNGIDGRSYYRQGLPRTAPAWLERFTHVAAADRRPNVMAVANDTDSLRWLVNLAVIELHPWLSRRDRPTCPDVVVFDLDVTTAGHFPLALEVALLLRGELAVLGLAGYPKTSGGDGLHVYVPLERGPSYAETHAFALAVARRLASAYPTLISTDSRPAYRSGQVLIDYGQNALGRTTAAVYSARPRPGAPVSAPLTWAEVKRGAVRPLDFTLRSMPARLVAMGDLFAPVLAGGGRLPVDVHQRD